jgi:hypothetical protein
MVQTVMIPCSECIALSVQGLSIALFVQLENMLLVKVISQTQTPALLCKSMELELGFQASSPSYMIHCHPCLNPVLNRIAWAACLHLKHCNMHGHSIPP